MVGPNQRAQGTSVKIGLEWDPATGPATGAGTPEVSGCNSEGRCFLDENGCTAVLDGEDLVHRRDDPEQALYMYVRFYGNFERSVTMSDSTTYKQRFEVRLANDVDAAVYQTYGSIAPLAWGSSYFDTTVADFPPGFIEHDGLRIPMAQMHFTNTATSPFSQAAAMLSQALGRSDVLSPQIDVPPQEQPPIPVIVGTGSPELAAVRDPLRGCVTDADCAGPTETRCVQRIDAQGAPEFDPNGNPINECSCETADDCGEMQECVDSDRGPAGKRCGVVLYDSAYQAFHADGPNSRPEALFIGPASVPLDTRACTSHADCIEPGQACITQDGIDCTDPGCVCRWHDQARWKFVGMHEFGHLVAQHMLGELSTPSYTFLCDTEQGCGGDAKAGSSLDDPPGRQGTVCSCDHINSANRLHCLQSLERAHDAFSEGWGHFIAASVYNPPTQSTDGTSLADDCTFVYYKEVRDPVGGIAFPPLALDCSGQDQWRDNHCGQAPYVARFGTERDWLQFLWNWRRRGPNNTSWRDLVYALRQSCNPAQCVDADGKWIDGCAPGRCTDITASYSTRSPEGLVTFTNYDEGQVRYVWGTPVAPQLPDQPVSEIDYQPFRDDYILWSQQRSLSLGVSAYFNARAEGGDTAAPARLEHFLNMGDTRGVDENTGL
jgi:hypothetical protein